MCATCCLSAFVVRQGACLYRCADPHIKSVENQKYIYQYFLGLKVSNRVAIFSLTQLHYIKSVTNLSFTWGMFFPSPALIIINVLCDCVNNVVLTTKKRIQGVFYVCQRCNQPILHAILSI